METRGLAQHEPGKCEICVTGSSWATIIINFSFGRDGAQERKVSGRGFIQITFNNDPKCHPPCHYPVAAAVFYLLDHWIVLVVLVRKEYTFVLAR